MGEQEYDFFATGRPAVEPPAVPTTPPVRRPTRFTDPSGRAVNQFGTPIDVEATPAGPAAAPGYGAQQYAGHGLTEAQWTPPTPALPPGAYVATTSRRPGQVLAAGVIAIVQGALGAVAALFGLLAVSALEGALGEDTEGFVAVSGFVRLILLVVLLIAACYLTAGIATAAGRRWGAWLLLVVESVGLVVAVMSLVGGDTQTGTLGQIVSLVAPVAVIVLLLLPVSRAWLQRR